MPKASDVRDGRLAALVERARSSLFFVPMLYVLGSIGLAEGMFQLDRMLLDRGGDVDFFLIATVDSARSILTTIAAATIAFAGVAFSVSMLSFQLASSQFSPRVLYGFFRDRYSKRTMGVAVGTFTYALMILRRVRDAVGDGDVALVPNVSIFVAMLLGITAVLMILGFISHSAHNMEVAQMMLRITREARGQVARLLSERDEVARGPQADLPSPPPHAWTVRATGEGWVTQIDSNALRDVAPKGGTVWLETTVGRYVTENTVLCKVAPAPDEDSRDRLAARACVAIRLAKARTMQQDIGLGIRQLVDIALRALSPGVNDPTTARHAVRHIGSILRDVLVREFPPRVEASDGRRLVRGQEPDHAHHVALAFDEIRQMAASSPAVTVTLLEVLAMLIEETQRAGVPLRAGLLRRQAALLLAAAEGGDLLPEDLRPVREAAAICGVGAIAEAI